MSRSRRAKDRTVRVAIILGILLALHPDVPSGQERLLAVDEVFDAYSHGNFDAVSETFKRVTVPISFGRDLQRQSRAWIEAGDPELVPRRRLVVASVALEVAVTMAPRDADAAMVVELVQWACDLVRRNPERTEAEHVWHRAALAVLQRTLLPGLPRGWRDPAAQILRAHIDHAESRFPGDPNWKLAVAVSLEYRTWYLNPTSGRVSCSDSSRQAIRAYEKLLADDTVGAEAHVRAAYLKFRCDSSGVNRVLMHLDKAEESTKDLLLLYLASFLRGQVFEHAGAVDRAAESYGTALNRWPGAQSAAIAFAAIRFRQGQREEALTLANVAGQPTSREDPWRHYGRGDYRLRELLGELRKAIT